MKFFFKHQPKHSFFFLVVMGLSVNYLIRAFLGVFTCKVEKITVPPSGLDAEMR